jgi:hypothetical protein
MSLRSLFRVQTTQNLIKVSDFFNSSVHALDFAAHNIFNWYWSVTAKMQRKVIITMQAKKVLETNPLQMVNQRLKQQQLA